MYYSTIKQQLVLFQRRNNPRPQPLDLRHPFTQGTVRAHNLNQERRQGWQLCAETHSRYYVQIEDVTVVSEIKLYYNKTITLLHGLQGTLTAVLSAMKLYNAVINLSLSASMARTLKCSPDRSLAYQQPKE